MGRHSAIDFRTIPPTINLNDSNKYCTLDNSLTSICDMSGNIIFYSNGLKVYNKNGHIMPNGNNINAGTISNTYQGSNYFPPFKGAIIIPFPNDTNKFYMFYVSLEWSLNGYYLPSRLYYLVVDRTLNNGLGDVILKDQAVINNDTLTQGELMAVKNGNGKNWWIIGRRFKNNNYYKILVDSQGVHTAIFQNIGKKIVDSNVITYVPDINLTGNKLAYLTTGLDSSEIDLFDFDRCTGLIYSNRKFNWKKSHPNSYIRSCCFSPLSRFLYVSDWDSVWQLDLSSSNILSSAIYLGKRNPYSQFFLMKTAPDGQIYVSHYGSWQNISVIQYPDSFGTACNFLLDTVHFGSQLNGPWADGGLPNKPNFALGAINCNVGIENLGTENNGLNIYPNPTNSNFTIASDNSTIKSITIYDIVGREIVYESLNKKSTLISLAGYSSGLYFIKVVNENGEVFTKKIVKE